MPSRDPRKPSGPAKAPPLDAPPLLVPLVGLKLFLGFCLLFVALRMELPQFQGKAMWERLIGYPLLAAAIPLGWRWLRRFGRDPGPYPYAADAMFTLGLTLDVLGNIPFMRLVRPRERTPMTAVFTTWREMSFLLAPLLAAGVLLVGPLWLLYPVLAVLMLVGIVAASVLPRRI